MAYEAASRNLSPEERKIIAAVLRIWRRGGEQSRRLALNFVNEQMLDTVTHTDFMRQLAGHWQPVVTDTVSTLKTYCEVSRTFSLRGADVRGNGVRLVGRAAAFHSFKVNVQKTLKGAGVSVTIGQLDLLFRSLVTEFGASVATASSRLRSSLPSINLTGNPAWCAFVNPHRNVTPFTPPASTAAFIRNVLGLGCLAAPEELILFTYDPDGEYVLKCPTVADARDYHYFRPAGAGSEHGWTKPLDEAWPDTFPQPESVHEPLNTNANMLKLAIVV